MNEDPKPPTELAHDLPRELERIILRCLRKAPARRFQHVEDLAVELEEIKTESGTRTAPSTESAPRRRLRWLQTLGVALPVAIVAVWLLWPKADAPLPAVSLEPLTAFRGDEQTPSLSPDGAQVAFSWSGDDGGNPDIYIMPVGTATPLRLTTDLAADTAPAWSPDGNRIAFVREEGTSRTIYLATPPVPNSEKKLPEVRPMVGANASATTLSWSPDSQRLFVAESGTSETTIRRSRSITDRRGSCCRGRSRAENLHFPAISPTGGQLAYSVCTSRLSLTCT